jgi:exoribonuclease II
MKSSEGHHRSDLKEIAHRAMLDRGLLPDFEGAVTEQLAGIGGPAVESGAGIRDLTPLPWCSIDNDDSKDLDQLTVSEELPGGAVKILVAVADVDSLVKKGTPIDRHARNNTTSVYTGACTFPMLPERLSTDLSSLNDGEIRLAIVIEYTMDGGGILEGSSVYRAVVKNKAKLAYNGVAAWLDGKAPMPARLAEVAGMDRQLRVQDAVAQKLKEKRHEQGALDLESLEPRPVFDGEDITDLQLDTQNRAKELIEDFMIAANGVTARFLETGGFTALRRVVRSPERWSRIVSVAAEYGEKLPPEPDSAALEGFLVKRRKADPLRFPDLSLVIVKLMGRGEYVVEYPGRAGVGHFGLAVQDYTHSTAPNRRYPDLITQRLLKAAVARQPSPYNPGELEDLAAHCTEKEDDANKVERQVRKSAAALLLEPRVGERFDGVVTGASDKGTWVRIFHPPVEGKVVHGFENLQVGDRVKVKLISTDVERGYIDFVRSGG